MSTLPSGMVTFLFTDIEGSTRLIELHPEAMATTQVRHNVLLRAVIEANHSKVFQVVGDAFCSVFERCADAAGSNSRVRCTIAPRWGSRAVIATLAALTRAKRSPSSP